MNALDNFQHIFINNKAEKTLFLLHGTGGSEHDLLPLVKELSDQYNFVGIKGNISEHGMARFFERDEFGVFDQESISTETQKLSEFITAWNKAHALSPAQTAFLGYSNGATMVLATAFYFPHLIRRAVVLHPMLPFEPGNIQLKDTSFLVSYGDQDQLIPATKTREAIVVLTKLGAQVTVVNHPGGHEIQKNEVLEAYNFLSQVQGA